MLSTDHFQNVYDISYYNLARLKVFCYNITRMEKAN